MYVKLRNCVVCKKDFEVFAPTSSAKICKPCLPEYNRQKSKEHYRRILASGKIHEYRKTNRENERKRLEDDATRLVARAKARASYKKVPCTITRNDLTIPTKCPVLGTEFRQNSEYAMSVDEIVPGKGYIPGNVQVISMKANAMKNSASVEELTAFANWVLTTVAKTPEVYEVRDRDT